jgi:hypothetical protein
MRTFHLFPDLRAKMSFEAIDDYFRHQAPLMVIGGNNGVLVTNFYHWSTEATLKPDDNGLLYASDETVSWMTLGAPNYYLHEITVRLVNPMVFLNQASRPELVEQMVLVNKQRLAESGMEIDSIITTMNTDIAQCEFAAGDLLGSRQICLFQPTKSVTSATCLGHLSVELAQMMDDSIVKDTCRVTHF